MKIRTVVSSLLLLIAAPVIFATTTPACPTGQTSVNGTCMWTLTVSPVPPTGLITDDNQAVRCGYDGSSRCVVNFAPGTRLHFWADAKTGYAFTGWTGACAGQVCYVTMDGNKTISANFPIVGTKTFTVTPPTGGNVMFMGGYTCPSNCAQTVSTGSAQHFTGQPATGYVFGAWGGACAGQGNPCQIAMNSDVSVSATFTWVGTQTITVSPVPTTGLITDDNQIIRCGYDGSSRCSGTFTKGARIHFWADPAPGRSFSGWTGVCSGQVCYVTTDANKIIGATFP